jgi:hypothetical protein
VVLNKMCHWKAAEIMKEIRIPDLVQAEPGSKNI